MFLDEQTKTLIITSSDKQRSTFLKEGFGLPAKLMYDCSVIIQFDGTNFIYLKNRYRPKGIFTPTMEERKKIANILLTGKEI